MNVSTAQRKKNYLLVQKELNRLFPKVSTALNYTNPFQLLIATILSAQCTDTLVNKVTKELFKKYTSPKDFAKAKLSNIQKDIYPVTFYKNKGVAIKKTADILIKEYKGKVPKTMEELIKLPGVARKTANVVLGHAYNINSGIVVDTHVLRLSKRLGLSNQTDPKKVESELMEIVPQKNWTKFADQLIWFGRKYCTAKNDKCKQENIKLKHY